MILTKTQAVMFNLLLVSVIAAMGFRSETARAESIPCVKSSVACNNLIPFLRKFYAPLNAFDVIGESEIAPGYRAVILRGAGPGASDPKSDSFTMKAESFGVFIIDIAGKHVLTLDMFPTGRMGDYDVKLGEHGDGYLVISGEGSTYGDEPMKRKYFYDIKSRKVFSAFSKGIDVDITRIIELNGAIYCIGKTDDKTAVIVKISFPQPIQKKIEATSTIQNEKIETILDAKKDGGKLVLTSNEYQYVLTNNAWQKVKNPTPNNFTYNTGSGHFIGLPDVGFWVPVYKVQQQAMEIELDGKMHRFLIWNKEISANGRGPGESGIYDIQGASVKFYPIPQPSYDLFRQLRPDRVEDGYTEEETSLETEIGASTLDGGRIIFGLGFYDGEGTSGVGGIGSFDLQSKKFEITYLKDISDFSVYSMLAEPDSIWLGLAVQPEGAVYPQGMVKINRKDNSLERYKIPNLINTIVRVGRTIYAGTSNGVVAFGDDGSIENIKVSINKDGGYGAAISKQDDLVRMK